MVLRSGPLLLLTSGVLTTVTGDTTRTAKDMALDFYRTILYSSVSEKTSTIAEADWRSYAEWDWDRSEFHETNETKKYPFLLCDEKTEGETYAAMQERQYMVKDALNLTTDIADVDWLKYVYPVVNSEETICVVGSFFSSVAAGLDFVVQPISFLMKINSATTEFSPIDYGPRTVSKLEYFVVGCPGLDEEYDEEWVKNAMRQFVPWLGYLVENGALPGQEKLLEYQDSLEDDPTFCDSTFENDVNVEFKTEAGYALVSLTTETLKSRSCFQIFAYAMAAAPEICYIERVAPTTTENMDAIWASQSNTVCEVPFHDRGLTGTNQIVSLSDSGLDMNSCYFKDTDPVQLGYTIDLTNRKVVMYVDFVDSTDDIKGHGTHVAGTIAGHRWNGTDESDGFANGVAPDANLAFYDLGETNKDGLSLPRPAYTLLSSGKSAGARIHSASWGSNQDYYTVIETEIDQYLNENDDFLMIVAAGNSGPSAGTIGSPAKAKNVLTVGATKLNRRFVHKIATFSSQGPTMDGRIKPDIVAHGTQVLSVGAESGASCNDPDKMPNLGGSKFGLASKSGTSMATPVVSGSAALVRQYFAEGWQGDGSKGSAPAKIISGMLLKAILINGARPLAGYAFNEVDYTQGFGRLSLIDSISLSGSNDMTGEFEDNQMITQGNENSYEELAYSRNGCSSDRYEFSVTLVWADPPGIKNCLRCLMNDLDLKVVQTSTAGIVTVHYPNGLVTKDSVNNVERIRFLANSSDSITVTVKAARLQWNDMSESYALAAVSSCNSFVTPLITKSVSECDSLYLLSGADRSFRSWWTASFVFVWFPLLMVVR